MRVMERPNIFVDQGQFSDQNFIRATHRRENVKFADNIAYDVGNPGPCLGPAQKWEPNPPLLIAGSPNVNT